ncbi:MAG: RhuM family protein [Oscillospiraceae bacterium]|nr:RhuM family protein [Oscillospiraceae bacterium]
MENKNDLPVEGMREIIFYRTDSGDVKVEILLQDESLWLTQAKIAGLFDVQIPAISKHLSNIFEEGELNENSVVSILETTADDGKTYKNKYYNLDAIIAVGYRVNSKKATMFRIWATKILKEFIIKKRANSKMPNMGLTSWKNAPDGKIRKNDVSIAKNYLDEKELDLFNRIVTMYQDYAELQAFEHRVMYMSDWVARLNEFLKFNHKDILEDSGKVSAEVAKIFAEGEYDKHRRIAGGSERSDFDQYLDSAHQEIPDVKE